MSKTTTQTQQSEPWNPAQAGLKSAIAGADQLYAQGPTRLGLGTGTQAALGRMEGGMSMTPQATALWGQMAGQDPYRNMDAMRGSVMSDVKAGFGSNYAGGAYKSGLAAEALGRGAGDALGRLEYDQYNTDQQRQMNLLGMAPQLGAMEGQDMQMALGAGQIRDQNAQQLADADWELLQRYSGMMGAMGGMGGISTGTKTSPWSLGDTGSAMNAVGGMFALSDRRLKENIKRIGKTESGAGIYEYTYKMDPATVHVGVMADEVPYAAVTLPSGYQAVNYGAI